jgi:hypothetical protein
MDRSGEAGRSRKHLLLDLIVVCGETTGFVLAGAWELQSHTEIAWLLLAIRAVVLVLTQVARRRLEPGGQDSSHLND